uniref:Uncharacterized protein n=1 Tax=Oryza rufipogon TaxID=4529 RepID=A0A0E0MQF4_ORYRU
MPAAFCYILIIVRVPLEPLDADGSEARVLHQDFILLRRRRQAEDHRDGVVHQGIRRRWQGQDRRVSR